MALLDLCNDARHAESFSYGRRMARHYTGVSARLFLDLALEREVSPGSLAYFAGVAAAHGIDLTGLTVSLTEGE